MGCLVLEMQERRIEGGQPIRHQLEDIRSGLARVLHPGYGEHVALVSRVAAVCALALLALASPAAAGPPGTWTKVHDADSNTTEVGLARSGNGLLNVLWPRDSDNAVLNTQVSANASNVLGPHPVYAYPDPTGGVSSDMALVPAPGGGLRAFFAGLSPASDIRERMATALSNDGVTWFVQPTPASDDRAGMGAPVYAAAGIGGTIFNNGVPLSIWGDPSGGYHVGTSSTDPDVSFGDSSTTVYAPNAATDSVSGQVVIAWGDFDQDGTLTQSIAPAGGATRAPGSQAFDGLERTSITGRDGPGIFVAYLRGSNQFDSKIGVWRFGAPKGMVLSPKDARFPGVTRGLDGRLWAYWMLQRFNDRIFAARSNEAATQFGAAVKLKPPGGHPTVYSTEGEGTAPGGTLDLVVLAGAGDDIANYHQRVEPGITLLAKPLGDGEVRFVTRDAGDKLATTITFAGETKQTGPDGEVVISAKPDKKFKATATKNGYHPASRKVKVK